MRNLIKEAIENKISKAEIACMESFKKEHLEGKTIKEVEALKADIIEKVGANDWLVTLCNKYIEDEKIKEEVTIGNNTKVRTSVAIRRNLVAINKVSNGYQLTSKENLIFENNTRTIVVRTQKDILEAIQGLQNASIDQLKNILYSKYLATRKQSKGYLR